MKKPPWIAFVGMLCCLFCGIWTAGGDNALFSSVMMFVAGMWAEDWQQRLQKKYC